MMLRLICYCTWSLLFVDLYVCSDIMDKKSKNDADKDLTVDFRYSCRGPDRKPYKDESCIQISSFQYLNYSKAELICNVHGANLITIDSNEKQKFVEDFLKELQLNESIWIGLKYIKDDDSYQWPYARLVDYSNWKAGHPKKNPDYCVELTTSTSEFGKWSENLCQQHKKIVLCEALNKWDSHEIQAELIFLVQDKIQLQNQVKNLVIEKNQLESKVTNLNNQLTAKITDAMKDLIPVGFVYRQLPKDKAPTELWPQYKWENISPYYAGIFFRVEGGNASRFGTIQEQDTRRLNWVCTDCGKYELSHMSGSSITIDDNEWTTPLYTRLDSFQYCLINFKMNTAETRPRNMAVKVWKRIK